MLAVLVALSCLLSQADSRTSLYKPTVTPFFSRVDKAPAFYVECRNNTGRAVSSAADTWPWAPGHLRIDGKPFVESGGIIGPGLSTPIKAGATWRGIIALHQSNEGYSPPVRFGANVRGERVAPLSPGRHTISVRCDGVWSDDYVCFWEPLDD